LNLGIGIQNNLGNIKKALYYKKPPYKKKEDDMTKKHFVMVAQVVSAIDDINIRRETALNFASEFQKENPRFDIERFIKACGCV
jgi:hypothetical protein